MIDRKSFLIELRDALDALPVKELGCGRLLGDDGRRCAAGVVCLARGLDDKATRECADYVTFLNTDDDLVWEITNVNDSFHSGESHAERFTRMRAWVDQQISEAA